MAVLGRRPDIEDPLAEERRALGDQRAALDDLKRELVERVAAVQERESELRAAMAAIAAGALAARAYDRMAWLRVARRLHGVRTTLLRWRR